MVGRKQWDEGRGEGKKGSTVAEAGQPVSQDKGRWAKLQPVTAPDPDATQSP